MAVLIGEADDLWSRWKGNSAGRSIRSGRCTSAHVQVGLDQIVDLGRGVRDPARHLLAIDAVVEEGERLRLGRRQAGFGLLDSRSCGR